MKSSKSLKNITVISDRKAQQDFLASARSPFNIIKPQSCVSQASANYFRSNHMPVSCKNATEQAESNFNRSTSASARKHKRQRSSSLHSKDDDVAVQ